MYHNTKHRCPYEVLGECTIGYGNHNDNCIGIKKCVDFLTEKLDFTTRQFNVLQKKYVEVLKLAKDNSDSYEYCLKELEEKLKEVKNAR